MSASATKRTLFRGPDAGHDLLRARLSAAGELLTISYTAQLYKIRDCGIGAA